MVARVSVPASICAATYTTCERHAACGARRVGERLPVADAGLPFAGRSALKARALLVGARLDLRTWPEAETLHRAPLAVKLEGGGIAVLFRYGVAVLLGASPEAERALRDRLATRAGNRYESGEP